MIDQLIQFLHESFGTSDSVLLLKTVETGFIAIAACLSYYVMWLIERVAMHFIRRSPTTWDDDLLNQRFLKALSQLMPALVVAWLLPRFFGVAGGYNWVKVVTNCYILWTSIYIVCVFSDNLHQALSSRENFKSYAVKGIFQMVNLLLIIIGVIFTISIIIGRSPLSIIMALGASAAILMLVFKDTILGLVASVQLTANNMLRKGDWIVFESHGANGEVLEINLTTVKVRNWDDSITTLPPYSLVSESFRNYQPMRQGDGRRVDRAVLIDANSVRFLTDEETSRLQAGGFITQSDLDEAGTDKINLRLLRAYLVRYLTSHPKVNDKKLLMVRQMEPTATGLPLQLYFFATETDWRSFEQVQSDIFDHLYAVIGQFGLRIYQVIGQSR